MYDKFFNLFVPGLVKLTGYQANIYVKPNARFRFFKPRPVSSAMRSNIIAYFNRLFQLGVIKRVRTVGCGSTPVVPVLESNRAVRIFGDLKVTVNSNADMQRYLLPHPDVLRAAWSGGKLFFEGRSRRRLSLNCSLPEVSQIPSTIHAKGSVPLYTSSIRLPWS